MSYDPELLQFAIDSIGDGVVEHIRSKQYDHVIELATILEGLFTFKGDDDLAKMYRMQRAIIRSHGMLDEEAFELHYQCGRGKRDLILGLLGEGKDYLDRIQKLLEEEQDICATDPRLYPLDVDALDEEL